MDNAFENIRFNILIIVISLVLATLKSLFVPPSAIGLANVLFYMALLIPLVYLLAGGYAQNAYTKWIVPFVLVWIVDIFVYDNTLTQMFLPSIIVATIVILYLTAMHKVGYFYQVLLPRLSISLSIVAYLEKFIMSFAGFQHDRPIYKRIALGVLVSAPFIAVFFALFMNADNQFNFVISNIFSAFEIPSLGNLILILIYFFMFLSMFVYGYLNHGERTDFKETKQFDIIVVGIFLGMLNLLFASFLAFQIAYLFGGEEYIKHSGITPAEFARQGFFQLATVIGLVVIIFLAIMRRFKGELWTKILMGALMAQTIIMGVASLKKMHLYQSLLGATTLRYYVEWFEYFLIAVLLIGIVFTLMQKQYRTLVNTVTLLGLISFTIVASVNVDYMVASHNIEKFKTNPRALDINMLSALSTDALPALVDTNISIYSHRKIKSCENIMEYHFGACEAIKNYPKHFVAADTIVVATYAPTEANATQTTDTNQTSTR